MEEQKYQDTSSKDFVVFLNTFSKIKNRRVFQSTNVSNQNITQWDEISINHCQFSEELFFKDINIGKSIRFENCKFSKRLVFSNIQTCNISFNNCEFDLYISFKNIVSDNIRFKNCTINNTKIIQLHEFSCQNFYFLNNSLKNDIHIKPSKVNRVILEGSASHYLITLSYLNRLEIMDEILLFTYQGHKTEYLIRNLSVSKLQVCGEVKDSSIILNKLNIGTAVLDNFSNYGNVKLTFLEALNEKSNIILKNSNLGKMQISSVDFSSFKRILISNTTLIEIIPVNIKWCFNRNIISESLAAQKESYRQLKFVNQKNEDIDAKLNFEKLEMHTFLDLTKLRKGKFRDIFVLYTNYLSNDFGLSWTRAFNILVAFSFISYILIKVQLKQIYFDQRLIADEIGYFINFVNPIHYFEKVFNVEKNDETNGAILIDSIAKIVNAYLVFQLISAFRKYSKK